MLRLLFFFLSFLSGPRGEGYPIRRVSGGEFKELGREKKRGLYRADQWGCYRGYRETGDGVAVEIEFLLICFFVTAFPHTSPFLPSPSVFSFPLSLSLSLSLWVCGSLMVLATTGQGRYITRYISCSTRKKAPVSETEFSRYN
jgi:hypothetical protein